MAAWHEPSRTRTLGLAFALYLTALLGLVAWVLYRVALPLPHLIP